MTRPRSDARYTSPETWVTDNSSPPASRPRRIGRTSHLALAGSGHLRRRGRFAFGLMRARGFAAVDAEFAGYRLLAVACGVPGSYRLFQERTTAPWPRPCARLAPTVVAIPAARLHAASSGTRWPRRLASSTTMDAAQVSAVIIWSRVNNRAG